MSSNLLMKEQDNIGNSTSLNSPRPQASSTLMATPRKYAEATLQTADNRSSLSSLGIVDVDKASLISDFDKDAFCENLKEPSPTDLDDVINKSRRRFQNGLDNIYKDLKTVQDNKIKEMEKSWKEFKETKFQDELSLSTVNRSMMSLLSNQSFDLENEKFLSSESEKKEFLRAAEEENNQRFGAIPIPECNLSVNSMSGNVSDVTKYFKPMSYSPDELEYILKNKSVERSDAQANPAVKSENIPSKSNANSEKAKIGDSCVDVSQVSSIASVNEIAAILRGDQCSANTPDLIVERLLTKGMSKTKDWSQTKKTFAQPGLMSGSSSNSLINQFQTPVAILNPIGKNAPSTISSTNTLNSKESVATDKCDVTQIRRNKLDDKFAPSAFKENCNNVPTSTPLSCKRVVNLTPEKHFVLTKTTSQLQIGQQKENTSVVSECTYLPLNEPLVQSGKISGIFSKSEKLNASTSSVTSGVSGFEPVHRVKSSYEVSNDKARNETSGMQYDISQIRNGEKIGRESVVNSPVIDAGALCVGTEVEAIVTLVNPAAKDLVYHVRMKQIMANGRSNFLAANAMLKSSSHRVMLKSVSETDISIVVCPLVEGNICILVEFTHESNRYPCVRQPIQLVGEKPMLRFFDQNDAVDFGIVPENSRKSVPISLKNMGNARLPLRFAIFEENAQTFFAKTTVEPGEVFECEISAIVKNFNAAQTIEGRMKIFIEVADDRLKLFENPVKILKLTCRVGVADLLIGDENMSQISLVSSFSPPAIATIPLKNRGTLPLSLVIGIYGDALNEFRVRPTKFTLQPEQCDYVTIKFQPISNDLCREVEFCVQSEGVPKNFTAKVKGILDTQKNLLNINSTISKGTVTEKSRPTTPKSGSSSSSLEMVDGPLSLDCTHVTLTWVSIPTHARSKQTITLRNRSLQREKLLLTIADKFGSFKFAENECYSKEMKLNLDGKESRKISVAFMPFIAEQSAIGKIVISRRSHFDVTTMELSKRVLPLYGYGGHACVNVGNVFHDAENKLWLNPDAESMESKFTLENVGDAIAFVKIVSDELDDTVTPDEIVLAPRESVQIFYRLCLTCDRVEIIKKLNTAKDMLTVNRLTIYYGNESTRLRIKKVWSNNGNKPRNSAINRIVDKLNTIGEFSEGSYSVNVENFSDTEDSLYKLWVEGVAEHTIGVLIKKQDLDSIALDSTVIFKNLNDYTITPEN